MVTALVTKRPYVVLDGTRVPDLQVVLPLQITVGRSGASEQPNASSLTFTYYGPVLPAYLQRGKTAEVHTTAASPDIWYDIWDDIWQGDAGSNIGARFIGRVTDLGAVLFDVDSGTLTVQVTCTGRLAEFGAQIVGDQPWPYETDGERAARIKSLLRAGFTFDASGSGALLLLPRDVDRQTALDLLHDMGASTGSVLTEWPDGSLHYIGFDQRLTGAYDLLLTESMIRADVQWQQSAGTLTDRVRVEFGLDTPDVGRPEYIAGDGTREVHLTSTLATYSSASIVGDAILTRWGRADLWEAPIIATDVHLLDQSTYDFMLTLVPGRVIWAQGMQSNPGAVDLDGSYWYIEGWQESYDRESDGGRLIHSIMYAVSDYRRFAVGGAAVVLTLTVTPSSWGMGNTNTAHAVITPGGGASTLPTVGHIALSIDDAEPYFYYDMSLYSPLPSLDIGIVENQLPPGKHILRASFTGWPDTFKPTQSNAVTVTVTDTGFTQATLTTPLATPHMGEPVTFEVDLFDPTDGTPEGTLTIERSVNIGGPWTRASPVLDCPGGDQGARIAWSWISDTTGTTYWRCNFVSADTSKWINTLTNVLGVRPLVMNHADITYPMTWLQQYDGNGNPLAGATITTGDWGDGKGDQRAYLGYGVDPTVWSGFTITLVEVAATVTAWRNGASKGIVRLGSHADAAAPAHGTDYVHRNDVTEWFDDTTRRIDITSWARPSLATLQARGLVFGPADFPGDPQYAAHIDAASPPTLRIVGFRWELS